MPTKKPKLLKTSTLTLATVTSLYSVFLLVDFEFNHLYPDALFLLSFIMNIVLFFGTLGTIAFAILTRRSNQKSSELPSYIPYVILAVNTVLPAAITALSVAKFQNANPEYSINAYHSMLIVSWPVLPLCLLSNWLLFRIVDSGVRYVALVNVLLVILLIVAGVLFGRLWV